MEAIVKNFSQQFTQSSGILRYPSFLREVSRNMDIWGSLDSYGYSGTPRQADEDALSRDYWIAMRELVDAQNEIIKRTQQDGKKRA